MEIETGVTPFGGRAMSRVMFVAQERARSLPEGASAGKWKVLQDLREANGFLGIGHGPLSVLNALLSFYPEDELSEKHGLIVFPSNQSLSIRANDMPISTLCRHLAVLVEAGLIIRRDSPNGKRYRPKGDGKALREAFGFSLAPLLARADEFHDLAEQARADQCAMDLMRERITLYRRDIFKLLELAREEGSGAEVEALWSRYEALVAGSPKRHSKESLELFSGAFSALFEDVHNHLKTLANDAKMRSRTSKMRSNASQYEKHQYSSNTDNLFEFEPAGDEKADEGEAGTPTICAEPAKGYPLSLVLDACPDIKQYYPGGIGHWRALMAAAAQVRGYLGISPSAYADALDAMGQENTAIVIACILQKSQHIQAPGGYLRALTEKAKAGQFSPGPMLMAAFKTNKLTPN